MTIQFLVPPERFALQCGRFALQQPRPLVMGILNLTPDSFSDGGRFGDVQAALDAAQQMLADGADLIDVGGESTRPGAPPVAVDDELARVIPVVERLAAAGVPVSVDTYKSAVMRAALAAGAAMINDVWALRQPGAVDAVADSDCAICLMHMQRDPQTMQFDPQYGDVVADVAAFLRGRVEALAAAGVDRARLVLDPGFGFGKTARHNFELLERLAELQTLGLPVLAGLSRKSMLGAVTGRDVGERLAASVAGAVLAAERGATLVRVHDVRATVDGLNVWAACRRPGLE